MWQDKEEGVGGERGGGGFGPLFSLATEKKKKKRWGGGREGLPGHHP